MQFPNQFISANLEYCTFEKYIPAPQLRREFCLDASATSANLIICGLGFYDLHINGKQVSKLLAPYISNPDDILYYDQYDVISHLQPGENTIGIVLGNGMQNALGGYVWDFEKAPWRSAPMVALSLEVVYKNGETFTLTTDEQFVTSPSPIYFDDLRAGEYYDARKEQPGWSVPGFNAADWQPAISVIAPRGEKRLCTADPIVITHQLRPVAITKAGDGYIYDFGVNAAGVCLLHVAGTPGQEIVMEHGEHLIDGDLSLEKIKFVPDGYVQKDIYICIGNPVETYQPRFTYHGFRYVRVTGITEAQATPDLLTYMVMNSDLEERGSFSCSDETANILQQLTRRSTLANFHYFPTDCPHREKNGWTGDAAVSAEHTLLNLAPENSYREWLRNVCKAQNAQGTIPGIVPTSGWGFEWGNGPAWDCALTYLPYYTHLYRGDKEILQENGTNIFRYLHYLNRNLREDGLLELGLGDWCPPGKNANEYKSPTLFTDSVISMDICIKAAYIFDILGWTLEKAYADMLAQGLRTAIREKLINLENMTAVGECQTSQAMALYYNIFNEHEKQAAGAQLLRFITEMDGHIDTGILGARVIFHVLSDLGASDLAFNMIIRPDYPSYGNWVARGATSLWENFHPEDKRIWSRNHHFFGDISGWFIQRIGGIRYNRDGDGRVYITPGFIDVLDFAEAFHISPYGKIFVKWVRDNGSIVLDITVPDGCAGDIVLPSGWVFEDGNNGKQIESGTYKCVLKQ